MGYKENFLLIFLISMSFEADNQEIICSKCECSKSVTVFIRIDCFKNVKSIIFNNESQVDTSNSSQSLIGELTIRNNEFTTLDQSIPYENLTKLDLAENKISHIADKIFSKLQKLEILILSRNNIENLDPDTFQGLYEAGDFLPLRSLKTLFLDKNNIKSLDSNIFEHIEHLESLSLAHNPLKKLDDHTIIAITNLINLKFLDLSYTQLSTLPQYFLHSPKYITVLNLSGNVFTEVPQELKEADNLEILIFNDNALVNLTIKNGFPKIPKLRILHMCEMQLLKTIGPGSLANLTNLEELYIAGNPILSHIDDAALATADKIGTYQSWPNINKLYLNDNQLSYINKSIIPRWDKLAELDLLNNPWFCDCDNQWMVDALVPIYLNIDEEKAKKLKCAGPVEMQIYSFVDLYEKNYNMRCLDYYGARPERDASLLIGMFAGVLIGFPIVLFCLYSYKRHWFGLFDDSPAAFTRQFYRRTNDVYEY